MLDRSRSRDRSKTGGAFSPAGLFVSGAQGAWYDPSDFSTLYQNSTGTTPVTAVEQPVGLMLDRSRGLVLGPELVTNGDFATDSDWTKGASWTISGGTANYNNAGAAQALSQTITLTAGRAYVVTYTVSALSSGFGYARLVGSATTNGVTITANGAYTEIIIAPASPTTFGFVAQGVFSIDNISVRELPGNHASQATSASRPILRARYNQLTYSEQFDNAGWTKLNATVTANAAVAPDAATTADKMVPSASSAGQGVTQAPTIGAGVHTQSVYAKADGYSFLQLNNNQSADFANFDLSNGTVGTTGGTITATITALSDGWYRCSLVYSAFTAGAVTFRVQVVASASAARASNFQGDGTSGIFLWGAQLLTAADQTSTGGAYQRIAAATDYDTSNPVWRPYLAFDGVDDFFNLASAISITESMTVVRAFKRASAGIRSCGLGATGTSAPRDPFWFTSNAIFQSLGGSGSSGSADTSTGSFVVSGRRNASTQSVRLNGANYALSSGTAPAVSGSFDLFGRTNIDYNNGPIYGLIVLDRELTGSELTATEQWMAGKTGVTI